MYVLTDNHQFHLLTPLVFGARVGLLTEEIHRKLCFEEIGVYTTTQCCFVMINRPISLASRYRV